MKAYTGGGWLLTRAHAAVAERCQRASAISAGASAPERRDWLQRAAFFHSEDLRYLKFLIPAGPACSSSAAATATCSPRSNRRSASGSISARGWSRRRATRIPHLTFQVADIEDADVHRARLPGPFDVIVIVDTLGSLDDCQSHVREPARPVHARDPAGHRAISPICGIRRSKSPKRSGLRMPQPPQNVLSPEDVGALVALADFEPVKSENAVAVAASDARARAPDQPLPGAVAARSGSSVPAALHGLPVAAAARRPGRRSATVVIPARNERGNIEPAVQRHSALRRRCSKSSSSKATPRTAPGRRSSASIAAYPRLRHQGDAAARKGQGRCGVHRLRGGARRCADDPRRRSDHAAGATAEILGRDPRPARASSSTARGWSIRWRTRPCGSSISIANKIFSLPVLLAAVAALHRHAVRHQGVAPLRLCCGSRPAAPISAISIRSAISISSSAPPSSNLKVVEVPIRYANRTYGETQISRFRHG